MQWEMHISWLTELSSSRSILYRAYWVPIKVMPKSPICIDTTKVNWDLHHFNYTNHYSLNVHCINLNKIYSIVLVLYMSKKLYLKTLQSGKVKFSSTTFYMCVWFLCYINGALLIVIQRALYTVSQKTRHQTISHNFANYYPIFNFFSLADSLVNLQQTHV